MFSAKKITNMLLIAVAASGVLIAGLRPVSFAAPADSSTVSTKAPAKAAAASKKEEATKTPEVEITNAVSVTPEELVSKPHEYLGKNVKFTANFFAFSNLALDYKPALRTSKTHLSLLVLKPGSHIPLSELKLAMMIPKEKDPETTLLAQLKDGDQIEVIGKEFSSALDDPWVEIFKLKKIGGSKPSDKDKEAKAETKSDTADKSKADGTEKKTDEKSGDEGKSK